MPTRTVDIQAEGSAGGVSALLQVLSICFGAAGAGEAAANYTVAPSYSGLTANPRARSSATMPFGPTRCKAPTATKARCPGVAIAAIFCAIV